MPDSPELEPGAPASPPVTSGETGPVDTGAVCPDRRRWWHRKPRPHVGEWRYLDMGKCAEGPCRYCGRTVQQRRSFGGKPIGPWLDTVVIPCTHGTDGRSTMCCMVCANERGKRGLVR